MTQRFRLQLHQQVKSGGVKENCISYRHYQTEKVMLITTETQNIGLYEGVSMYGILNMSA